jgi:DNA-binding NtrC family response regulator
MRRILLIEPTPAIRETIAQLLGREYEIDGRETLLDARTLEAAAERADLVIASAGPPKWTAQLARLKSRVLLLTNSVSATPALAGHENVTTLPKRFNPYELKAAVANLMERADLANGAQAAPSAYLDFPYLTHGAARLARRFAALSLPVLIWGERGCGQDRVARAMLRQTALARELVVLNARDLTADCLKYQQAKLHALLSTGGSLPGLLLEELDQVAPAGQSSLLELLEGVEARGVRLRIVATANADLLERLYRGEFLERLYYRIAKLALPLTPLRERRADIPALARRLACDYLTELDLREVDFTPAALAGLRDYLWFDNLNEMELVIARTLAIHSKSLIDAADLVFDVSALVALSRGESAAAVTQDTSRAATIAQSSNGGSSAFQAPGGVNGTAMGLSNLRLLVHELAHELKNPMVTIKTFAQLLAERYDDATFRARFQDVVDGDIERMDELLGVMTEYAGFDRPHKASTALVELLNSILETLQDHCAKRQIHLGWKGNGHGVKIMADAAQLQYALRNTLLAILAQAKTGSEIELSLGESGALVISYLREAERVRSLAHYLKEGDVPATHDIVPLRIMLAREIIERSGGRFGMDQTDGHRDIVSMEFPVV